MGNGKKWAAGDIVGCMLDLTSGTMSFTLNGKVCRYHACDSTTFH
jgi:hypothetical protein